MKLALGTVGVALLATSALAQNLVPIPPHASVYNGFSRGMNFTANTSFIISQLNLPTDAFVAGDTASYMVILNGVEVLYSVGNPGAITTNVLVNTGDVVDIIGNWSPATTGNFTAHNSYGSAAPYATTIEGVAHTLNRTGWQWDIGDTAYQSGALLAPAAGSIGRVEVYTTSPSGFATKTPFGQGCYDAPRMVYEQIPGDTNPIDLIGTAWTMIYVPSANGGNYVIIPGGPAYDAATAQANGTNLTGLGYTSSSSASWDDASIIQTMPFSFPFPGAGGGMTTDITINSNGKIYLGNTVDATFATNGANYASIAPFQGTTGAGLPVLSPFNCDLDPVAGGNIWYEDPSPSGGVRITWDGIPNWQDTAAGAPLAVINDIQMEITPSGQVFIAYGPSLGNGGSANNDAIVGFSAGGGEPTSTMVDWSALSGYESGDGAVPLTIDANNRPVIGTVIDVTVSDIPAGSLIAAIGYGLTNYDPGIPLDAVGAPGCNLHVSPDVLISGVAPGATFTNSLNVPNNINLVGYTLGAQGIILSASVPNALGGLTSNGLELVVDAN